MNPYGSVEVPDHVPEDWQRRYGGAPATGHAKGRVGEELRARLALNRLVIWLVTVTVIAVAMMWPATHLPRLVAVGAFVAMGVTAAVTFVRWVLAGSDPR